MSWRTTLSRVLRSGERALTHADLAPAARQLARDLGHVAQNGARLVPGTSTYRAFERELTDTLNDAVLTRSVPGLNDPYTRRMFIKSTLREAGVEGSDADLTRLARSVDRQIGRAAPAASTAVRRGANAAESAAPAPAPVREIPMSRAASQNARAMPRRVDNLENALSGRNVPDNFDAGREVSRLEDQVRFFGRLVDSDAITPGRSNEDVLRIARRIGEEAAEGRIARDASGQPLAVTRGEFERLGETLSPRPVAAAAEATQDAAGPAADAARTAERAAPEARPEFADAAGQAQPMGFAIPGARSAAADAADEVPDGMRRAAGFFPENEFVPIDDIPASGARLADAVAAERGIPAAGVIDDAVGGMAPDGPTAGLGNFLRQASGGANGQGGNALRDLASQIPGIGRNTPDPRLEEIAGRGRDAIRALGDDPNALISASQRAGRSLQALVDDATNIGGRVISREEMVEQFARARQIIDTPGISETMDASVRSPRGIIEGMVRGEIPSSNQLRTAEEALTAIIDGDTRQSAVRATARFPLVTRVVVGESPARPWPAERIGEVLDGTLDPQRLPSVVRRPFSNSMTGRIVGGTAIAGSLLAGASYVDYNIPEDFEFTNQSIAALYQSGAFDWNGAGSVIPTREEFGRAQQFQNPQTTVDRARELVMSNDPNAFQLADLRAYYSMFTNGQEFPQGTEQGTPIQIAQTAAANFLMSTNFDNTGIFNENMRYRDELILRSRLTVGSSETTTIDGVEYQALAPYEVPAAATYARTIIGGTGAEGSSQLSDYSALQYINIYRDPQAINDMMMRVATGQQLDPIELETSLFISKRANGNVDGLVADNARQQAMWYLNQSGILSADQIRQMGATNADALAVSNKIQGIANDQIQLQGQQAERTIEATQQQFIAGGGGGGASFGGSGSGTGSAFPLTSDRDLTRVFQSLETAIGRDAQALRAPLTNFWRQAAQSNGNNTIDNPQELQQFRNSVDGMNTPYKSTIINAINGLG